MEEAKSKSRRKLMKDYRQAQRARLPIIAEMYKRGYSYREIRSEVMARLDLQSYSLQTLHKDVNKLLEEWRETRIENIDLSLQLELQRIDDLIKEAWEAWEKSKQDSPKVRERLIATPNADQKESKQAAPSRVEKTTEEVNSCGDPRYLDIIHKLLQERRKLLGLYKPEKNDIKLDVKKIFADKTDEELQKEIDELKRKLS